MGTVETPAPERWFRPDQDATLAKNRQSLTHLAYLVTILIKGLVGLLEFCGGIVIAVVGPRQLYNLVLEWTNPELYETQLNDALLVLRHGFHILAQSKGWFVVFYLLVHGALKMAVTGALLRGHGRWIFPFACAVLMGFIGFFCFDLSHRWSNFVLGLALFDTLTLALVLNEWVGARRRAA